MTDGPHSPFPTAEALLAILPDPPAPGEWDPPLEEVLQKRREIAQARLPRHQDTAERARELYGPTWSRMDAWRVEHAPEVPFVSPIFVAACVDNLEERHETLDAWFARGNRWVTRLLTQSANMVIQDEREWFRVAESGYRVLARARALLAALRDITADWYVEDPMAEDGVRIYRLLGVAMRDLEAVDSRMHERYDQRVWGDDEREAAKEILEHIAGHLRVHVERAQEHRRSERIRSRRARRSSSADLADSLCVTCGKRPRHFGEYCKRCCPPDERPHGKV